MDETVVPEGYEAVASALRDLVIGAPNWDGCSPAAYAFRRFEFGNPYYVGMAGDVPRRMHEHRRAGLTMVAESVFIYHCASVQAAQRLERNLILYFRPEMNNAGPSVSENERWWFWTLYRTVHESPSETLGWCPNCGELLVFRSGAYLPATSGRSCAPCSGLPRWEANGDRWLDVGGWASALLVGYPSPWFDRQERELGCFR